MRPGSAAAEWASLSTKNQPTIKISRSLKGRLISGVVRNTWITFELVKEELELETETYDLFGHSAGGQILHRLVIFHPNSKADRILAANSGWYTVPTFEQEFPYGLKDSGITEDQLEAAFSTNLVVFLGEEDDADETRGSVRRTSEADRQGTYRLERGKYFFRKAREAADALDVDFEWKLEVVPGVATITSAWAKQRRNICMVATNRYDRRADFEPSRGNGTAFERTRWNGTPLNEIIRT